MRKFHLILTAIAFAFATQAFAQSASDFTFSLDDESNIVVTNNADTNPIKLFGAEFRSPAGLLTFGSAAPFGTAFSPSNSYIPLADPNGQTLLDGTITFDIQYSGDPMGEDLGIVLSPVGNQGVDSQVSASFVPEPSAYSLMSIPFAMVLFRFRKQRSV